MTPAQLTAREQQICQTVTARYLDPTGKADPIYDGVVDPTLYLAAPARILWILKEPWDEPDCSGGGWSLAYHCLNLRPHDMAKGPTFQPIIYISYAILNGHPNWDSMPYISAKPDMAQVLRSIAFINVKKLPGPTRSNNAEILAAYLKYKDIILDQIEAYNPHIIIGCRPHMPFIMEDMGIQTASIAVCKSVSYARSGTRLLMYAHHPSQTAISRQRYVDDILQVVASSSPMLNVAVDSMVKAPTTPLTPPPP